MSLVVKKEKLPKSKIKLEVVVPLKDLDEYREKALEKLSQEIEIKGFRKGKAPKQMVIDRVGETRVDSEALEIAVPETSYMAMAQEKIVPLEQPKVSVKQFEKDKDLIYFLEVSILPEIEIKKYKDIKIKKDKVAVKDSEIKKALKDLRKRMASFKEKSGVLKKGDWAEISFEGSVNGVKKEKLTSPNFPFVVGEAQFIPGFEKKLIGMKKGEEKNFKLALPKEQLEDELKGKKADFKVKLNQLKIIIPPKLDKSFAAKLGAKDLADLKKRIKEGIESQKEKERDNKFKQELIEKIASKVKVELPEAIINQEKERLISDFTRQLNASGGNLDDYLVRVGRKKEDFDKDLAIQAEKNIKISLTLSKLSELEKIEATEAEVEKEIEDLINKGMQQGVQKSELVKNYDTPEAKRYVKSIIRNRKTIDKLVELNKN